MAEYGKVIPALVTPFSKDLRVNYRKALELAEHLVDNLGCDGLLLAGTTGEAPTLSEEEKEKLFREMVTAFGDSVFIWAGTGTNDTQRAVRLSWRAQRVGVDGIMLVTPYYNKPPQKSLFEHFLRLEREIEKPIMLYNVPSRTGVNLEPETVARLARLEGVVALKEASGDLNQVGKIAALTRNDFLIYSGDDSLTLPILSVGGVGVVSVAAHLVGDKIKAMIEAHERGEVKRAAALHRHLFPLFEAMFYATNPLPVKEVLNMQGMDVGNHRGPLSSMGEEMKEKLKEVLRQRELL